jgi:hypothetical protein
MKTKNCIKSMIFLFAILFSVSVNAYNSLKQGSSAFNSSKNRAHVNVPFNDKIMSENIIFEKFGNENDNENIVSESFLILPFFNLTFNGFENKISYYPLSILPLAIEPIFLTIRSILI